MASRALIDKLSTASSSWVRSTSAGHKLSASCVTMRMLPPIVLCSRSRMPATVVEVGDLGLEPLPTREGQELVGQPGARLGDGAHIAKALLQLAVDTGLGQALFQKGDVAEDDGEQIIEIVVPRPRSVVLPLPGAAAVAGSI